MSQSEPRPIRVGPRSVGPADPVFVMAEAGVNHNGDVELAKRLVKAAKGAGADAVKFQTFAATRVASATAPKAPYQARTTGPEESQLEMLRRLELDEDSLATVRELCDREGIAFLSTPYSVEDVEVLERLDVPAYKVPSALIVEPVLLERVADCGKPVIMSTGLATLEEVHDAVAVVRSAGNDDIVVLQCTTSYPADPAEANLLAMETMRHELNVLAGYSDHTVGGTTAIAAVALGAVIVEKHLTLDRALPGPDHATSATPDELAALVRAIREVESALGDGVKRPSAAELANLESMRRSLVASAAIPAGTILEATMITTKRPASGIPPRELAHVVGRSVKVEVLEDQPLEWWMLE